MKILDKIDPKDIGIFKQENEYIVWITELDYYITFKYKKSLLKFIYRIMK